MRSRPALLATLVALGGVPLVAFMAPAPRTAEAATSVEMSMSELVGNASLVVAGTPLESRSYWETDASTHGRRIVTYTRVRVDRLIDGTAGSEVWVRTLGGEVDDIGQQVAGEAVLRASEPSLLFLRSRVDGTHGVVAMGQGHYLLDAPPESGRARVRSPLKTGHVIPKAAALADGNPPARSVLAGHTLDDVAQLVAAERRAHPR